MSASALTQIGDLVLLISEDGKRFYTRLKAGRQQHTHQGIIDHDQLIAAFEQIAITHKDFTNF